MRPVAPYQTKYEWSYLYSALEVDGDNAAGVSLPATGVSPPELPSQLFLAHLSAQDPQAEHVVIWDQAGFHPKADAIGLPSNIHLLPLPPYSPELNPVEIIGDLIKDRIANTLWNTFEALEEAISEELRPLGQSAEHVRSLVSHPWLLEQVNVSVPQNSAITC